MFSALRTIALALPLAGALGACGDDSTSPPTDDDGTLEPDAGAEGDASSAPTVTIRDGQLRGEIDGGARRFLGIPFAKPPIGQLRWRPPEPNDPWPGVRDATAFSAACAQPASLQGDASESEDCLYLNVWAPATNPTDALPVMVWFHGGGNEVGSTADSVPLDVGGLFYDGRSLAESYGVIVVTTNYRLGPLGFFHHPALAGEGSPVGNQGIQDQQRALEWVRDNIAAFGGDPENVTIFGESAGATDVCFHIAAPASRGLFHAAISQSGGCTTRVATPADVEAGVAAFVDAMGCTGAGSTLACLRDVPVSELLTAAPLDNAPPAPLPGGDFYQGARPRWSFSPIVDGAIMPDQPRARFAAGEVAMVPYILGSNTDEGTLFHIGAAPVMSQADYLAALERRFGSGLVAEIAEAYPASDFESADAALQRVSGDAALVCATHDTALRAAAAGLPVWMYNFDLPIPVPGLEFLGATHGAEIAFVFDSVDSDEQATVGDPMRRYWTRMAASGDPNGGGAPNWPAFSEAADVRVNFHIELTAVSDFRAAECTFWRERVYDPAFVD